MRILIIASQRCGGQTLGKWLSKELNCPFIHEPHNEVHNTDEARKQVYELKNVVVKMVINEWKNVTDVATLIGKFDKVIGLIRNDIDESAISMVYSLEVDSYNISYSVTDVWIKDNQDRINQQKVYLTTNNELVTSLPILQVVYENIFINTSDILKIINYLCIEPKHQHMLDSKLRYRKINFI
jgi:hypothetical protein